MPWARWHRGERATHWCHSCVASLGLIEEPIPPEDGLQSPGPLFEWADEQAASPRVRVELVDVGRPLANLLAADPSLIHSLTPSQFEDLICDRLHSMGFEPRKVGKTNQRDGGFDVIFWSRSNVTFPILGAAQVKHHRSVETKEGPRSVREFAGSIAGHPFNAALLVTNTSFTPDAEWFAREHAKLVRLRGFTDIRRWLAENFADTEEWREFPETIEVCPGLVVPIRPRLRVSRNTDDLER